MFAMFRELVSRFPHNSVSTRAGLVRRLSNRSIEEIYQWARIFSKARSIFHLIPASFSLHCIELIFECEHILCQRKQAHNVSASWRRLEPQFLELWFRFFNIKFSTALLPSVATWQAQTPKECYYVTSGARNIIQKCEPSWQVDQMFQQEVPVCLPASYCWVWSKNCFSFLIFSFPFTKVLCCVYIDIYDQRHGEHWQAQIQRETWFCFYLFLNKVARNSTQSWWNLCVLSSSISFESIPLALCQQSRGCSIFLNYGASFLAQECVHGSGAGDEVFARKWSKGSVQLFHRNMCHRGFGGVCFWHWTTLVKTVAKLFK